MLKLTEKEMAHEVSKDKDCLFYRREIEDKVETDFNSQQGDMLNWGHILTKQGSFCAPLMGLRLPWR